MSQREQVEIELLRKQLADAGDGVFTAADEAKLDGIETGATADQAWGDITGTLSSQTDLQSALDAKQVDLDVVSQAEAEAGTATTERIWTAERVAQAIAALESGGGGGDGRLWIPYHDAVTTSGSPAAGLGTTFSLPYTALDKTASEGLIKSFNMPQDWVTFDAYVWLLTVDATASNDVYLFAQLRSIGDGDDASDAADVDRTALKVGTVAVTGGAAWTVNREELGTGFDATIFVDRWCFMSIQRTGAEAADDFDGDIGLIGIELVKAS